MAAMSKSTLTFGKSIKLGTIIEWVGLMTSGSVRGHKVSSIAATYTFDAGSVGRCEVKNTKSRPVEEFKSEFEAVSLSLQMLEQATDGACFDKRTNLTFADLDEIWHALSRKQPIKELLEDANFIAIFPHAEFIAGEYESLRHKSGCAVFIETRNAGVIAAHHIDAPVPGAKVITEKHNCGVCKEDGYLGSDEIRWSISKLLGSVPVAQKGKVFAWASEAIYTVEEFHNTRGAVPVPEVFEYKGDGVHLVANRDLRFERICHE